MLLAQFVDQGISAIVFDQAMLIAYSGQWGINFLVISLAIPLLCRLSGMYYLAGLASLMIGFALFYASIHLSCWLWLELSLNWSRMIHLLQNHSYLLTGAVCFAGLFLLFISSFGNFLQQITAKLLVLVTAIALLHFFLAAAGDRTMPGIYAGICMTLLGYGKGRSAIPKSLPALLGRFLKR